MFYFYFFSLIFNYIHAVSLTSYASRSSVSLRQILHNRTAIVFIIATVKKGGEEADQQDRPTNELNSDLTKQDWMGFKN